MSEGDVKFYVVMRSTVTRRDAWYAYLMVGGYNIHGGGDTIELAYLSLTKTIWESGYFRNALEEHLQKQK